MITAVMNAASLGGGVSDVMWGFCADQMGRKVTLIASCLAVLFANLLTSISTSYILSYLSKAAFLSHCQRVIYNFSSCVLFNISSFENLSLVIIFA